MKRYAIFGNGAEVKENAKGDWVKYADHLTRLGHRGISKQKALDIATTIWGRCTNDWGDLRGKDMIVNEIAKALMGEFT